MIRTHDAGTLRAEHAGTTVTLAGWVARRRDHGGVVFIDLRDASGVVAGRVPRGGRPRTGCATSTACRSPARSAAGRRATRTPSCPPATIEVVATALEVLVRGRAAAAAGRRPRRARSTRGPAASYRYLDLRRSGPANALRLRSRANQIAREVLHARDFLEIETPTLTRSTPEGARDFLVPVRLQPGTWYALPQSPQLFKQLLMVAGLERYYQIARCYRDEDFRADRQPEFTQLDIEMSFVDPGRRHRARRGDRRPRCGGSWPATRSPTPIPRMTYARRDGPVRLGQARPALRRRADRADRATSRHRVPGVRRRSTGVRRRGRHARRRGADPQGARRLAGLGQGARRPRPGVRGARRRDRRAARPGRQEPLRRRTWPGWPTRSAPKPGDAVFFAAGRARARRRSCSARPGSRSPGGAA